MNFLVHTRPLFISPIVLNKKIQTTIQLVQTDIFSFAEHWCIDKKLSPSALQKRFTIVIVTHNMQQAARVSDYTVFFFQGRIIEFDTTEKIFTNPGKQQTEQYITGRFG